MIWGDEFGRTTYTQTRSKNFGRDHHPRYFSMWMAGSIKRSIIRRNCEFGYNIPGPFHVHDLQATILHLLGIDHEALPLQGRDFRLTDVHGQVIREIIA